MSESGDSQWMIVGRTLQGDPLEIGPYEKRYAEQMLADIRNRVASGDVSRVESTNVSYADVDLTSLGMEPYFSN